MIEIKHSVLEINDSRLSRPVNVVMTIKEGNQRNWYYLYSNTEKRKETCKAQTLIYYVMLQLSMAFSKLHLRRLEFFNFLYIFFV